MNLAHSHFFNHALVLLMWPSTNQTPQNRAHDHALSCLMHTLARAEGECTIRSRPLLHCSLNRLVLLTWPSTNQTPHNRSHDRVLNRLMHTLVCIIQIMHTFQRPTVFSGKWVALNYLDTSSVCITGLVSALGQCSNCLEWIMHSPLALALSALNCYYIALVH